jgi:hypothetical protein
MYRHVCSAAALLSSIVVCSSEVRAQKPLQAFHSRQAEALMLNPPSSAVVNYVSGIMQKIGLPMRFEVRSANVANAQAQISDGKRQILYNPDWMLNLVAAAQTNWALVQILAHEVGHHLSFHEGYSSDASSNREQELEADYFSGYILARLGASVDEATAAMRQLPAEDSETHPGSRRRVAAATKGWGDATGKVASGTPALPDAGRPTTTGSVGNSSAQQRRTIWDHNGSEMYLVGDGPTRRIYYHRPRPGMIEAGVKPGTLLFAGDRSGTNYRGISHIFNSRCGKFYYEVAGHVENDVRIVLAGKAPGGLDANCKPTRSIDDRLVFTYLRTER